MEHPPLLIQKRTHLDLDKTDIVCAEVFTSFPSTVAKMAAHRMSLSCLRSSLRTGSPWRSALTAKSSSQRSSPPASVACVWPQSVPVSIEIEKPNPSTCPRRAQSILGRLSEPSAKCRYMHLFVHFCSHLELSRPIRNQAALFLEIILRLVHYGDKTSRPSPKVSEGFCTLPCLRKSRHAIFGHEWSESSCQITKESHVCSRFIVQETLGYTDTLSCRCCYEP